MQDNALPPQLFARQDESPDSAFYREPRFVTHIDDATIDALTEFYRTFIPERAAVLDLMSSWVSHLPPECSYDRVAGLGMNEAELAANPSLDDHVVQDLNAAPELPYPDRAFDRITLAVSIQYLTHPVEVLSDALRTLKDGGEICIAMSHRLFPTKAILAFHRLSPADRVRLVSTYLELAGFKDIRFIDRSPDGADPLWLVAGRRAED
ncbi:MAG: methyltransferase domain-containing protein [Pseudomonadales bacterium]|nr:methyltransferase domain-containing protein [Pseudomonadales bacterium]NIX08471.1 methyltransferase domain-containing protein [Pseudomonadales bacterium]